jgi:hypothetical protein
MYGLIEGGPKIDVARCDQMLKRGLARGITPSKPVMDLAIDLIRKVNA